MPGAIEVGIHDWEHHCDECHIDRMPDPSLPQCPSVDCSDATAATQALQALQASAVCGTTCGGDCGEHYRVLRAFHDTCEEEDLPHEVETFIHTYEEPCEAENCNAGAMNATGCDSHDDHDDHDHDDHDHDDHDHDHDGTSCCAVADTMHFAIDCDDQATQLSAWSNLTSSCTPSTCEADAACTRWYYIIQAHHDHCLHDQVRRSPTRHARRLMHVWHDS